jgi:hypothetical protein
MLFTLLLISNEPVITALPENGNPVPVPPPPFIAYDAVKANDAEVAVVELVANDAEVALTTLLIVIGNVVAFPLVNVIVALFTDAVSILNNDLDAVNANDADVDCSAYDADCAQEDVPKNEPDISYDPVGNCDILNINFPRLIAPISL